MNRIIAKGLIGKRVIAAAVLAFTCILAFAATPTLAQPLADRIPQDAVIYAAWTGADDMGPGYQNSKLQALQEMTQTRQLISDVLPHIIQQLIARHGTQREKQQFELAASICRTLLHKPAALYFGPWDFSGPMPKPTFALIIQAGDQADALHQQLTPLMPPPGELPVPVQLNLQGNFITLTIGDLSNTQRAALGLNPANPPNAPIQPPSTININKTLRRGVAATIAQPVGIVHVNARALLEQIDQLVAFQMQQAEQHAAEVPAPVLMWPTLKEALGLPGLNAATLAVGFNQRDWMTALFLDAPAPRRGVLVTLDHSPLPDDALRVIPASARAAGAIQFDLTRAVNEFKTQAAKINPAVPQEIDNAVAAIQQQTGVNLMTDLVDALGPAWSWYIDANVGGTSLAGITCVNHLRNPKALANTLAVAQNIANALLAQQFAGEDFAVTIRTAQIDSQTISYIATPILAPAWAVHEDKLYLSLFPEIIPAAIHHAQRQADGSMLNSEAFNAMRQRAGAPHVAGFAYLNLPETASEAYTNALAISRLVLGFADMARLEGVPAAVVPPIYRLKPLISPTYKFMWADEQGFYVRAIEPYPGASAAALPSLTQGVGAAPLMAGIMLPALGAARQAAQRTQAMANARMIGQAVFIYANENNGKLPPDLGTLVANQYITPDAFSMPGQPLNIPPDFDNWPAEQKKAWINNQSPYILNGSGRIDTYRHDTVLIHQDTARSTDGNVIIIWGDGHATSEPIHALQQNLRNQNR